MHPQVPFKPKTPGLAIASLICGILAFCIPLLPGLIGIILGIIAIRKINASNGALGGKGLAIGGLVCSGLGTVIVTIAVFLSSMFLPSLAKAKTKANRLKCANNLKTISQSFNSFSGEIDGSTPHLYGAFAGDDGNALARALGYDSYDDAYDVERWMSAFEMRNSLVSARSLVSPLDSRAVAAQGRLSMKDVFDTRSASISVPAQAQSYAIAMQGDLLAGETVLAMTRNIGDAAVGTRESYIRRWGGRNSPYFWKYPNVDRSFDHHKGAAHMEGDGRGLYDVSLHGEGHQNGIADLEEGQGNWATSAGAVYGGSEFELNEQLIRAEDSFLEGDSISTGLNLIILRPY